MKQVTITERSIRKIRNQDAFNVKIEIVKDFAHKVKSHYKQFVVHGSRKSAQARMSMQLRNMTQGVDVVKY